MDDLDVMTMVDATAIDHEWTFISSEYVYTGTTLQ